MPEVYSNSAEPPKIIEKLKSGKTNESFIVGFHEFKAVVRINCCLLYTSDAADE